MSVVRVVLVEDNDTFRETLELLFGMRDEGRGLRSPRRDGVRGGGVNLTAENTAVVLDSTADFPEAPERFRNFRVVPLYVRFGDESFKDYVEITPELFYERLQSAAQLPTTSQPT